jgi:hypothetical protein
MPKTPFLRKRAGFCSDPIFTDIKGGKIMQRKTTIATFVVIFTCVFFALYGHAFSEEFSADFVMQGKGMSQYVTGKIFVKGDKMRQEMVVEGMKQIMIFRPDKAVIWTLMPEGKMYMEMPYQTGDKRFEKWSSEKESKAKYLGKETVSGLACKKYELVEGGEKVQVWISEKLPFPAKMEHGTGIVQYKNIKWDPVQSDLFEIPSQYQKMSMPMMPEGMGFPK